ncbi:uncharacterized protein LOC144927159 [Branchiostoma floridae x Branchiostoma belcheri]
MAAYCVYTTCRRKPKVADGESNPLKANNQKINNGKNSGKGIELEPYNKAPKQAFGPNTATAAGVVAGGVAGGGTAAAAAASSNNAAGKKSILKNGGGAGQKAPVTASSKFSGSAAGAGTGAGAGAGAGVAAGLGAGAAASSFNATLPGAVPNNNKTPRAPRPRGPNDDYAIDPVTGREYVYDTKTGERFWSPSPGEIVAGVWSTPLVTIKAANKFKKNAKLSF